METRTSRDPVISSPEVRKDWMFLASFLLLVTVLVSSSLPELCGGGHARAREGIASSLISQLSQSAKAYELDYAVYPPGNGTGSKVLTESLQRRGAKQMQYFEFNTDMLDQGNVVNPVWGKDGEPPKNWIHYRCPGLRNLKTFDLWCADSKGKLDGINNWEP